MFARNILRPKILSFGRDKNIDNHPGHISRKRLAKKIIYKLKKNHNLYMHYNKILNTPMW